MVGVCVGDGVLGHTIVSPTLKFFTVSVPKYIAGGYCVPNNVSDMFNYDQII
jgi:hypothetical protein